MEMIQLNKELYDAAHRITEAQKVLYQYAREQAQAEVDMDKALAIATVELKDKGIQMSVINTLAKAQISDKRYKSLLADNMFKASFRALDALQTQITALQTIMRYQSEMGRG